MYQGEQDVGYTLINTQTEHSRCPGAEVVVHFFTINNCIFGTLGPKVHLKHLIFGFSHKVEECSVEITAS